MSSEFARTTAALAADRRRGRLAVLAIALALLALWAAWLTRADISIHLETDRARIEVMALAHPVHVEVGGRVRASHLELGRAVVQGEVLVELDREGPELELDGAEARLAANRAVLRDMERLVAAQRAVIDQLEDAGKVAVDETTARARRAAIAARFLELNARRWAELREQGVAAELDVLKNQADAQGGRSLARADGLATSRVAADQRSIVKERQVDVEELQVEMSKRLVDVAADEALVRKLRADIARRTIRAPVDGRLGWVEPMPGGVTVSPGQRIAAVVPSGDVRIVAYFPAREAAGRLRAGQEATLELEAYPRTQYGEIVGRVARVGIEPSEPHGGELRVELEIDARRSGAIPRSHGLQGTLAVTVEHTTPVSLLLRAIGKHIAGPERPEP